jgi:hypothetical protein
MICEYYNFECRVLNLHLLEPIFCFVIIKELRGHGLYRSNVLTREWKSNTEYTDSARDRERRDCEREIVAISNHSHEANTRIHKSLVTESMTSPRLTTLVQYLNKQWSDSCNAPQVVCVPAGLSNALAFPSFHDADSNDCVHATQQSIGGFCKLQKFWEATNMTPKH